MKDKREIEIVEIRWEKEERGDKLDTFVEKLGSWILREHSKPKHRMNKNTN